MRAQMHTALALTGLFAAVVGGAPAFAAPPVARTKPLLHARSQVRAAALRPGTTAPPAQRTVGLLVELDHPPTAADLTRLRAAGAEVAERGDGSPRGIGRVLAVESTTAAVDALVGVPGVLSVRLDGSVLPHPRPLDVTTPLLHAPDAHRLRDAAGLDATGEGTTICDVDSGVDVFHPFFFRGDGGVFPWIDVDGDGAFSAGVDKVDLGDGPVVVRHLDAVKASYGGSPVEGDDGVYQLGHDFLYADGDGSGEREFGASGGFDDASPSFGEIFLVPDDVDGDGVLGPEERLIGLGTSKIAAFKLNNFVYTRGTNLSQAPWTEAMQHGTGASGVLVGGLPGLTDMVGVAPGADLLMATDTEGGREFQMTDWCIERGARVVLHEYAPWVGYHLDGSSPMERLIDQSTAQGVSHINPAGNLSGAMKLAKLDVPTGVTTDLPLRIPGGLGVQVLGFTFLWRTPARDLTFELRSPDGATVVSFATGQNPLYLDWPGGYQLGTQRLDSSRGTAMTLGYLYPTSAGASPLPAGDYTVAITDPASPGAAPVELIAYVFDEVSGWGVGAHFPEHVSEDHLVGYPGTADHGMGIAAYVARGAIPAWGAPGERAAYSGRGHRIDGERDLWISGPADPFTSGKVDGVPLSLVQYGGTSGASPHVAGAAALLIQMEPDLQGDDVRARFADTAIVDAFTGEVPNDDFGYGKVDAYRAITGEAPPEGAAPTIDAGSFAVVVGQDAAIDLAIADPDQDASTLEVAIDLDYDGSIDVDAVGPNVVVRVDGEGDHLARARVRDATGRTGSAILHLIASAPVAGEGGAAPSSTDAVAAGGGSVALFPRPPGDGSEEGCGCELPGAPGDGRTAAGLLLAALALASGVARRRRGHPGK